MVLCATSGSLSRNHPSAPYRILLVEEPQISSDVIEVEITKAGSRFDMLLETTHPSEAGESVNERRPLAARRAASYFPGWRFRRYATRFATAARLKSRGRYSPFPRFSRRLS